MGPKGKTALLQDLSLSGDYQECSGEDRPLICTDVFKMNRERKTNIAVLGHSVQKEDGMLLVRQGGNRVLRAPSGKESGGGWLAGTFLERLQCTRYSAEYLHSIILSTL